MAIFRGTGGQGDSTTDTTVSIVTQKAVEADASATAAASSATSAANSASSASTSATNAATSESNAATSESNASTSENNASTSASQAATSATNSASSATASASSASSASTSATNAATSATAAQTAETNAETAETNAETAYADTLAIFGNATDVQNAVDDAEKLAINPEDSQYTLSDTVTTGYSALHYAAKAEDHKTAAEVAKTSAETAQGLAETAETAAETAQGLAETAQTAAETAQSLAETAQAAAQLAQANTEAVYDNFDDRYLGSKSSDPTLDNDNNALLTGALYFNTTENEMRVYTGTAWEPVQELSGDQTVNSLTSNNNVVVKGNLEVQGTTITVDSATAQTIDLGDNDKIRLGDSDDLQIYHSGSNSVITDVGQGSLYIGGDNNVIIASGNLNTTKARFTLTDVELYYEGEQKLATTSSGVDITGTVVADGLTVSKGSGDIATLEGTGTSSNVEANLVFNPVYDVNARIVSAREGSGLLSRLAFETGNDNTGSTTRRLNISSNGDISFYEDTGTTAKLTWDASAESLGLGTTSPQRIIHTKSSVPAIRLEDSDVSGLYHEIVGTASGEVQFKVDAGNVQSNTSLQFYVDGTERAEINSTGIDVTGAVTADGLTVDGDSTANGIFTSNTLSPRYRLTETDSTDLNSEIRSNNNVFQIRTANDAYDSFIKRFDLDNSTGDISFYDDAGTSQDFYWDASTSRLGIGTTTPFYQLHVKAPSTSDSITTFEGGSVTTNGQTTSSTLRLQTWGQASDGGTRYARYNWIAEPDSSWGSANLKLGYYYDGNARPDVLKVNHSGDVIFYAQDGTTEAFYWDKSTSRLGLGTTSPDHSLHIYASTARIQIQDADGVNQYSQFYNSNGDSYILSRNGTSDGQVIFLRHDGTTYDESMRIDSSGNVGIGTASVTAKFETVGGTGGSETTLGMLRSASTDTNTSTVFRLTNTTATGSFPPQGAADIGAIRTNSGASGATDLFFRTSSGSAVAERMRITSDGNVYIGDSSPGYYPGKLDVTGTITARVASSGLNTNFNVRDADEDDLFSIYTDGTTGEARLRSHSDNPTSPFMTFYTGSSEAMRIDSSGRLGIGTTSPASALHIRDTSNAEITIQDAISSATARIGVYGAGGNLTYDTNASGDHIFTTNNRATEFMRIDSNGRVGIGVSSLGVFTTDGDDLIVGDGASARGITINSGASSYGNLYFADPASTNIGYLRYYHGDNSMRISTNGSEQMRIDSSGRVGIGTTSPSELLDVRGNSGSDRGIQIKNDGTGRAILVLDSGSASNTSLRFKKQGTETARIESLSNAPLTFRYGSSNTEAARIDSSGNLLVGTTTSPSDTNTIVASAGIYLGGTATANLLDDYEEGTWTPVVSGTGSNPDLVYTSQFGTYIKIGRAVHITGSILVDSVTTSGTGILRIDGLPFTAKRGTTNGEAGVIPVGRFQRTVNDVAGGVGFSLQTIATNGMYLYATPNTTSTAVAVSVTELKSLFSISFGGTYFEDA